MSLWAPTHCSSRPRASHAHAAVGPSVAGHLAAPAWSALAARRASRTGTALRPAIGHKTQAHASASAGRKRRRVPRRTCSSGRTQDASHLHRRPVSPHCHLPAASIRQQPNPALQNGAAQMEGKEQPDSWLPEPPPGAWGEHGASACLRCSKSCRPPAAARALACGGCRTQGCASYSVSGIKSWQPLAQPGARVAALQA